MDLLSVFMINAAITACCMIVLWVISVFIKDVSIIDIFWGAGFVVIAWTTHLVSGDASTFNYVLLAMVTIWGLRLTAHLAKRNLGKGEDSRYAAMREKRGSSFIWSSLFIVFGLQAVIMLIVSLPLQVGIQTETASLTIWSLIGAIVWLVGLSFEAIGDYQLSRFKRDESNKGKVLKSGLWRYTRHPNYFGDAVIWWGFFLFVVGAGVGWWTFFSPLAMTFLLMRVSGVTLLEQTIEERRPEYAKYKRETSSFFPWPPKHADSTS